MRLVTVFCVVISFAAIASAHAQPPLGPRTQPETTMGMYAPNQHELYDGRFVIRGTRVYQIHFMVTQGMRDRETLKVMLEPSSGEAGAVNPATQQLDFYIRSPARNEANHPNREVFDHFFAMEVTWR
jgi:hypothetical protein